MKELIAAWKEAGKKILVVYVPCTWPSLSRRFWESYVAMTGPDVQEEMDKKWNVKMVTMTHNVFPIDRNRNSAVERARREFKADYMQFLDADMVFPKDAISRLFSHCSDDFPLVSGLYWRKAGSTRCIQGKYSPWSDSLEKKRLSITAQGFMAPDGTQTMFYRPLTSFDVAEPIDVTGGGCLLARMDVFDKLELPYFKYVDPYLAGGDYTLDGISEDMHFNSECKKKGIRTLVDPSIRCGHLRESVIGCPELE